MSDTKYVAVGSTSRYDIQFVADEKLQLFGCDDMTNTLITSNRIVKTIAFGEDWNLYFVAFAHGNLQHCNIPN